VILELIHLVINLRTTALPSPATNEQVKSSYIVTSRWLLLCWRFYGSKRRFIWLQIPVQKVLCVT